MAVAIVVPDDAGIVVIATQPTTATAASVAAAANATAAGRTLLRGASTVGSAAKRAAKRPAKPGIAPLAPRKLSPITW